MHQNDNPFTRSSLALTSFASPAQFQSRIAEYGQKNYIEGRSSNSSRYFPQPSPQHAPFFFRCTKMRNSSKYVPNYQASQFIRDDIFQPSIPHLSRSRTLSQQESNNYNELKTLRNSEKYYQNSTVTTLKNSKQELLLHENPFHRKQLLDQIDPKSKKLDLQEINQKYQHLYYWAGKKQSSQSSSFLLTNISQSLKKHLFEKEQSYPFLEKQQTSFQINIKEERSMKKTIIDKKQFKNNKSQMDNLSEPEQHYRFHSNPRKYSSPINPIPSNFYEQKQSPEKRQKHSLSKSLLQTFQKSEKNITKIEESQVEQVYRIPEQNHPSVKNLPKMSNYEPKSQRFEPASQKSREVCESFTFRGKTYYFVEMDNYL